MLILRANAITQKGVLLVGVNRGLAFYISGTSVDVDLYALREDLFNERYPAAMPVRTSWAVASLSSPAGGQAVTAKAGAVLRWARQVVGRDGWDGTLTPKDRRNRPKLHHGRRPKNLHNRTLLSDGNEVYFNQANEATAADIQTADHLRENIMSKIAVSKGTTAPKSTAASKPAAKGTAPKTDAKAEAATAPKADAKNVPAKPKGLGKSAPAATAPKADATPKTEPKASKVAKTEAPKTEGGATRGRKRDEAVFQTKVIATDKTAREGSFFGIVKAEASKPVVLEDLIQRVADKVTLRSEKDAETVVRCRVRDCFTRLGFLTEA